MTSKEAKVLQQKYANPHYRYKPTIQDCRVIYTDRDWELNEWSYKSNYAKTISHSDVPDEIRQELKDRMYIFHDIWKYTHPEGNHFLWTWIKKQLKNPPATAHWRWEQVVKSLTAEFAGKFGDALLKDFKGKENLSGHDIKVAYLHPPQPLASSLDESLSILYEFERWVKTAYGDKRLLERYHAQPEP